MSLDHESDNWKPSVISYGNSPSQFILLYKPKDIKNKQTRKPSLAVIIHGGFWKGKYGIRPATAAIETLAPDLQSIGLVVAEIEYRRSEDLQWGWPYTNQDVLQAYRAVVKNPSLDYDRVFVLGHSAGGYLALWLLANLKSDDIIPTRTYSLAPIGNLEMAVTKRLSDDGDAIVKFMHGSPSQGKENYRQACVTNAASILAQRPVTIVVGGADIDVPLEVARSVYDAIQLSSHSLPYHLQSNIEYKFFSDMNHYDLVNAHSSAWQEIRSDIQNKIE